MVPLRPEVAVASAFPPEPPTTDPAAPEPEVAVPVQSWPGDPTVTEASASPVSPLRESPTAPVLPAVIAHALPLSPLVADDEAVPPAPGLVIEPAAPAAGSGVATTVLRAAPVSPERAAVEDEPRTVRATATESPDRPDRAVEVPPVAEVSAGEDNAADLGTRTPASPVRAADTAVPETATETAVAIPGAPAVVVGAVAVENRGGSTVACAPAPADTATAMAQLGTVSPSSPAGQCTSSASERSAPESRSQLATSTDALSSPKVSPAPASRSATCALVSAPLAVAISAPRPSTRARSADLMLPTSMVVARVRTPLAGNSVEDPVADTAPVLPVVADDVALPPPVTLTAVASPLRPDREPEPSTAAPAAEPLTRPRAATAFVGPSRLTETASAQKQDSGRPLRSTTDACSTDSHVRGDDLLHDPVAGQGQRRAPGDQVAGVSSVGGIDCGVDIWCRSFECGAGQLTVRCGGGAGRWRGQGALRRRVRRPSRLRGVRRTAVRRAVRRERCAGVPCRARVGRRRLLDGSRLSARGLGRGGGRRRRHRGGRRRRGVGRRRRS